VGTGVVHYDSVYKITWGGGDAYILYYITIEMGVVTGGMHAL